MKGTRTPQTIVILISLLVSLAAAGCAAPDHASPPHSSSPTLAKPTLAKDAALANSSSKGEPTLPSPWHGVYRATIAATPCIGDACADAGQFSILAYSAPNKTRLANATTFHARVTWNATAPTPISFRFISKERRILLEATVQASPGLAEVGVEKIEPGTDYYFTARPSPAGAWADQDVAVDAWYS